MSHHMCYVYILHCFGLLHLAFHSERACLIAVAQIDIRWRQGADLQISQERIDSITDW